MEIQISSRARHDLKRVPKHIRIKFDYWVDLIMDIGLRECRKYKGFHDEPLKGKRKGQRSVRLAKAYRVIYRELDGKKVFAVEVLEVNKHVY